MVEFALAPTVKPSLYNFERFVSEKPENWPCHLKLRQRCPQRTL
jgi:hypothetical protein